MYNIKHFRLQNMCDVVSMRYDNGSATAAVIAAAAVQEGETRTLEYV